MLRNVRIVFVKELRVTLRDKRTLFIMLVVPVLLYPAMLIGFSKIAATQVRKLQQQVFAIAISGAADCPDLVQAIKDNDKLKVQESASPAKDLESGRLQLWLKIGKGFQQEIAAGRKGELTIHYNGAKERSSAALRRASGCVERYAEGVRKRRLAEHKVAPELLDAVGLTVDNVAPPKKMAAFVLGPTLALMIVTMSMTGAFYPALDLCAGEKERGTIETLLVSPAERTEIVLGKFLTICLISIATTVLNLASMCVTFLHVGKALLPKEKFGGGFALSIEGALICVLVLLPMAAMFSSLCLAISSFARSYREGQHYLTPIMLIALPLAMAAVVPNLDAPLWYSLVPVMNVALLLKKLFVGEQEWLFVLGVLSSTTLLAGAALYWAATLYNREEVMFRSSDEAGWRLRRPGRLPGAGDAVLMFFATAALMIYLGGLFAKIRPPADMTQADIEAARIGILAQQLCLILLPVAAYSILFRFDIRRTFRLRRPGLRNLLLSLPIGLSAFVLLIAILQLQMFLSKDMKEAIEQFEKMMTPLISGSLPATILVFALVPAVCEETLFRGFMLTGLSRHSQVIGGCVTAVLFAVMHLDARAWCIFPLGLVLAYVVLRTGSLLSGIIVHFVNNATTLAVFRLERAGLLNAKEIGATAAAAILLVAAITLAASIYLLSSGPDERAARQENRP